MSANENNLIWIDLEMTGLDPERDRIIEIATLVTDANLNILAEGPTIAVHQSDEQLALERAGLTMGDLTLIDMHEAFAAQTLANIQLLGSERFARDVLGRAHATGEVDESKTLDRKSTRLNSSHSSPSRMPSSA